MPRASRPDAIDHRDPTLSSDMPDFETLEQQFDAAKIDLSPAEAQGLLCGLLCHARGDVRGRWLDELLPATSLNSVQTVLDELYSKTCEALNDQDFGFEPMLPNDRCSLSGRSQALSLWCQSFLYGLGLASKNVEKGVSSLGREALRDLTEITRMDTELMEESDENEAALIELTEFLRMAVITIYEELAAQREAH